MLSYLKEEYNENDNSNVTGDQNTVDSVEKENDSEDYLAPVAGEKTVKQTSMLLVILFAVGSLVLWFMIKQSTPAAASAAVNEQQTQIETALARVTGLNENVPDQVKQIVNRFYEFSNVPQVDVSYLKKNPFNKEDSGKFAASDFADTGSEDGVKSTVKNLVKTLVGSEVELELYGIIGSDGGYCCMVNDALLNEGDSYKGYKVSRVTRDMVIMEKGDTQKILKMAEDEY